MGFWRYIVIATLLYFLVGTSLVLAQTINLSNDPKYAEGFSFYCPPYKFSFESGKSYLPSNRSCVYSVPSQTRVPNEKIIMSLYRGTPGHALHVHSEPAFDGTFFPTLVQVQDSGSFEFLFEDLKEGDDFFGVIFSAGSPDAQHTVPDAEQFNDYFTTGSTTGTLPPSQNYRLISWKWGPKPANEYDPVIVIPGIISSWTKNGQWVVDPIFHTYDNLLETLSSNGYINGTTLFTLPYNWAKTNTETALLLKEKIQEIKNICNCSRVDIIAHSMGGLVTQQYLQSDEYANDIDQVIFVGTPHFGAPLAYPTWEGGEVRMFGSILDGVLRTFLNTGARQLGYQNIVDFIHTKVVSVSELLPIYHNYLYRNDTELIYPEGYPRNFFLENLVSTAARLAERDFTLTHIQADNNAFNTVESYSIGSPSGALVWEHGAPIGSTATVGDGTVPYWSSEIFGSKIFENTDHTKMVSVASGHIFELLNNKQPSVSINDPYLHRVFKGALFIKVLSPVDIQITAPDGKRLGKDFGSNTEFAEIPDAFYSGFLSDDEYAIILDPLPGTYKIQTVGTGSGLYTLLATRISEATTTQSEVTGTTTPSLTASHTLTLPATSTDIRITKDDTGTSGTITPETCTADIQAAYRKKWITKKQIYNELLTDCKLLKVLFSARDKAKTSLVRKGILLTIRATLDRMERLARDKSNTKEGRELILKNTTWFRIHEL